MGIEPIFNVVPGTVPVSTLSSYQRMSKWYHLIHATRTRDSDDITSTMDDDRMGQLDIAFTPLRNKGFEKRKAASGNEGFSVAGTNKRRRPTVVSAPEEFRLVNVQRIERWPLA